MFLVLQNESKQILKLEVSKICIFVKMALYKLEPLYIIFSYTIDNSKVLTHASSLDISKLL